MKSGLLFRFMWCGLFAHGNARSVGNQESSDAHLLVADYHSAAMNATSNSVVLEEMKTPDCELLKHPVEEHPEWNFETANLAKCECGPSWALLKCYIVIPNDHIFDERNIAIDPSKCGRSVYDAVPRWPTAKSRPRCVLDKDNVAHLTFNNGIGTNVKHIKKGLDEGTCGYFKNVQCIRK